MDYKEKYEMALEGIQEILGSGEDSIKMSRLQLRLQGIFPELKESEDEGVRKEILDYIIKGSESLYDVQQYGKERFEKWIAWLEKQGEQKPAEWDILSAKKGDMLSNGTIVLIVDSIGEFEGRPIINSWYFADSEKFYGKGTSECDRWEVGGFRTATKIECNYLLKMIADAEYEWDADRKELKKIEQKPAWSKEDEKHFSWLIEHLGQSVGLYDNLIEWLKSLKDRCTWKPSNEQIDALQRVINRSPNRADDQLLGELLKQLQKLVE